jgi:hypothetical protein
MPTPTFQLSNKINGGGVKLPEFQSASVRKEFQDASNESTCSSAGSEVVMYIWYGKDLRRHFQIAVCAI